MDGKNVTLKDIHNLKAKFREENRGGLKDTQLFYISLMKQRWSLIQGPVVEL